MRPGSVSKVTSAVVKTLLMRAKREDESDPCAWLEARMCELSEAIVDPDEQDIQGTQQNGKSFTFFQGMTIAERLEAFDRACELAKAEAAAAAGDGPGTRMNNRILYQDVSRACFH